ncbi:MAG: hypothetical protein IPH18_04135 [Chitinophagaceae bacterium]|nr:hypothetical protein [Chitinophagaceae bacterium]
MRFENVLGYGFSESVYKDAMEVEFHDNKLPIFGRRTSS